MAQTLAGKVAVVAGASGVVGSGIVWALLSRGATVVAPIRSPAAKPQLLADLAGLPLDKLDMPVADVSDPASAAALAAQVKDKWGTIDYAVSSIGGWWAGGPLTEQSLETFNRVVQSHAGSHFVFAKHFAPLLRDSPDSSYLFISSPQGEAAFLPGTSLFNVGAAAQLGVSIALRAEYAAKAPRVNELRMRARFDRHVDAVVGRIALEPVAKMLADMGLAKTTSHRRLGELAVDILTSDKKGEVVKVTVEDFTADGSS